MDLGISVWSWIRGSLGTSLRAVTSRNWFSFLSIVDASETSQVDVTVTYSASRKCNFFQILKRKSCYFRSSRHYGLTNRFQVVSRYVFFNMYASSRCKVGAE